MRSTQSSQMSGKSSKRSNATSIVFAILIAGLALLAIGTSPTYGQSSDDNVLVPRETYEQLKAAVDELAAARPYIKALEAERNLRTAIDKLRDEKEARLAAIVDLAKSEAEAEKRARISTQAALEAETRRANMLEREVKRKGGGLTTALKIAGVAIGVALLLK